jgi:hypothetical protein
MAQMQPQEVGKIFKPTWVLLAVMAAVFGYWWNSVAAGIFMLMLLGLLMTIFNLVLDALIGVLGKLTRIEDLLERKNTVHIGTIPR